MTKSNFLRTLNFVLYLFSCALISAGIVLKYRFTGVKIKGVSVVGLSRHDWEYLHFLFGVGFFVLAFTHLLANWSWVKKVAAGNNQLGLLLSIGLGILILGLPWLFPLAAPTP